MLTCRIQIEFRAAAITVCLADQAKISGMTDTLTSHENIAKRYRDFAEREAKGRSPLYDMLSRRIADDAAVLDFLSELPEIKQQPNLLLGAIKYLFGAAPDWPHFKALIEAHRDAIRACMLGHATQ